MFGALVYVCGLFGLFQIDKLMTIHNIKQNFDNNLR